MSTFAPPPALVPFCRIDCEVGALVSLGAAPLGERRYVPILGGTVSGPELTGRILSGGVDWQWSRSDDALEIAAHYVIEAGDGAQIEVQSNGLRCGSPEVMARLRQGELVGRDEMYFRTVVRLTTGAPAWAHLNRMLCIAAAARLPRGVGLDIYRLT
jgi:hypothetical protein